MKNGKKQFLAGGNLKLIEVLEHLKRKGIKTFECETIGRDIEKGIEYVYFCDKAKKIGIAINIILDILVASMFLVIIFKLKLVGKIFGGIFATVTITVIILIQYELKKPIISLKLGDDVLP